MDSKPNPQGETDISKILSNINPILNPNICIFTTIPYPTTSNDNTLYDIYQSKLSQEAIICTFREKEGITLVLEQQEADKYPEIKYDGIFHWITLEMHTSLSAIGLTAKFAEI